MKYPMTPVIATRRIRWRFASGDESIIEASFGMPALLPQPEKEERADAYCPYQISRFKDTSSDGGAGELLVEHRAYGVDAVQALYHALSIIGVELSTLAGSPHPDDAFLLRCGFPHHPDQNRGV